ncbi:MAG: hypothetical protein ABH851_04185 [Methanobacteriota archaeon]
MEKRVKLRESLVTNAKMGSEWGGVSEQLIKLIGSTPDDQLGVIEDLRGKHFTDLKLRLQDEKAVSEGRFQSPVQMISQLCQTDVPGFSFCVNPVTRHLLVDNMQKGHDQMLVEHGIEHLSVKHFCRGGVVLDDRTLSITQPSENVKVGGEFLDLDRIMQITADVVVSAMREAGVDCALNVSIPPKIFDKYKLIDRGETPDGVNIPAYPDVVGERGWQYTRIKATGGTQGSRIHYGAAQLILGRVTGSYELFNNLSESRGCFITPDIPSWCDIDSLKTTGGDGYAIVRSKRGDREGIPQVFDELRRVLSGSAIKPYLKGGGR